MLKKFKVFTLVFLAILITYLCMVNQQEAQVNFPPFGSRFSPAFLIYMIAFFSGCLFTSILMGIPYYKKTRQVKKLNNGFKKYSYDLDSQNIKSRFEV